MKNMLGEISVKDLHGPWADFMSKLQGNDSARWFNAFKRFLRKENPWAERYFQIGISSITPNTDDSNIQWLDNYVVADNVSDAEDIAIQWGYRRNVRVREIQSVEGLTLICGKPHVY